MRYTVSYLLERTMPPCHGKAFYFSYHSLQNSLRSIWYSSMNIFSSDHLMTTMAICMTCCFLSMILYRSHEELPQKTNKRNNYVTSVDLYLSNIKGLIINRQRKNSTWLKWQYVLTSQVFFLSSRILRSRK